LHKHGKVGSLFACFLVVGFRRFGFFYLKRLFDVSPW
jgi:hypothetical protein